MPKTTGSTFVYGELFADTNSLLPNTGNDVIPLDVRFDFDQALVGQNISVDNMSGFRCRKQLRERVSMGQKICYV